ncbi:MAG: YdiU family protein [Gammaproteobacteria bacterium HGW-Gammaproteobacteria-3]|nr:MAG: YdiU family protein [Gammaproteobacteria bacterium HGW-Gammaproteobacteria-3]
MNAEEKIALLDTLHFDNRFVRELPADPESDKHPRQVLGACYSRVQPAHVARPQCVAYSKDMAARLDLPPYVCESDYFTRIFSGNRLAAGMEPYATCYGGHQFGQWAGQLGDGRVINLGEVINRKGERWTLQLKGAGPTPYSRRADGLAVLRSSVREFLCSEAMHHLGIPTTRALSLILTGEKVLRDMFYDGNPQNEPGAIVCRVSPSFTRFGSFEIFSARGDLDLLRKLVDYTIRTDFPHLGEPSPEVYSAWFHEVCLSTAALVVHWQRVGFVHGVMNTDNMSILGLTIDYGPYGWLENYDPAWTPNTTDAAGRRYRFGNQPQIAFWNLAQLANAIYPLLEQVEPLQQGLALYRDSFALGWQAMMADKLGLARFNPATDDDLVSELLTLLHLAEMDMILFYRKLAQIDAASANKLNDEALLAPLLEACYTELRENLKIRLVKWLKSYLERIRQDETPAEVRRDKMNAVNPKYVLRNYLAQLATDQAEQGDFSMIENLLELLRRPYDEQPEQEKFAVKRPDWARHRPGCSMLSCSS